MSVANRLEKLEQRFGAQGDCPECSGITLEKIIVGEDPPEPTPCLCPVCGKLVTPIRFTFEFDERKHDEM